MKPLKSDKYVFGAFGYGTIESQERFTRLFIKRAILWRHSKVDAQESIMEIYNYQKSQWIRIEEKSYEPKELIQLAGA